MWWVVISFLVVGLVLVSIALNTKVPPRQQRVLLVGTYVLVAIALVLALFDLTN